MKRFVIAILTVCLMLCGLVGCTSRKAPQDKDDNLNMTTGNESAVKSADSVKQIAFMHAGAVESDVYDLELDLDNDNGVKAYEIEFRWEGAEYDYKIDAVSGEILKAEKDGVSTLSNAATHKSADEAKAIAFAHAGLLAEMVYDLEIEFDEDNGVASYEIGFKSKGYEYDYDIHAVTGEVIKSEKERID